jgi:hypothetical protein
VTGSLGAMQHNGTSYPMGATLELSADEAKPYLQLEAIEPVTE